MVAMNKEFKVGSTYRYIGGGRTTFSACADLAETIVQHGFVQVRDSCKQNDGSWDVQFQSDSKHSWWTLFPEDFLEFGVDSEPAEYEPYWFTTVSVSLNPFEKGERVLVWDNNKSASEVFCFLNYTEGSKFPYQVCTEEKWEDYINNGKPFCHFSFAHAEAYDEQRVILENNLKKAQRELDEYKKKH